MFKVPVFRQTVTEEKDNRCTVEQITYGYVFVDDQYDVLDKNLIMKKLSVIIYIVIPKT